MVGKETMTGYLFCRVDLETVDSIQFRTLLETRMTEVSALRLSLSNLRVASPLLEATEMRIFIGNLKPFAKESSTSIDVLPIAPTRR